MLKKNKKNIVACEQCGKDLSKEEISLNKTKCENCIGKKAGKTKKILKGIGSAALIIGSGIVWIVTKGKRGGLK